jgi:hypothetical protein
MPPAIIGRADSRESQLLAGSSRPAFRDDRRLNLRELSISVQRPVTLGQPVSGHPPRRPSGSSRPIGDLRPFELAAIEPLFDRLLHASSPLPSWRESRRDAQTHRLDGVGEFNP